MRTTFAVLVLVLMAGTAGARDRETYNRRAGAADAALFQQLDLDRDGKLTREEAQGDLNLGPRFEDMDVNRDGVVTSEELQRYLERAYGYTPS